MRWRAVSFLLTGFSLDGAACGQATHRHSVSCVSRPCSTCLTSQCMAFLTAVLAPSTHRSYNSGLRKFLRFCQSMGLLSSSGLPFPVSEWTLMLFVTWLVQVEHLSPASVSVYLSAVRSSHIELGFPDPSTNCLHLPRLVRGIKRTMARPRSSRLGLPISKPLLAIIFSALDPHNIDHLMFWALLFWLSAG